MSGRPTTRQKTGVFRRISPDILDQFSHFIHDMKALYVQIMKLYLIFQFVKGRCHGNQIMLQNCYQCRLIPLAFVAIVVENELQYHGLSVHINSTNDACIPCENFVKFGQVTPELIELICERLVWHDQKTGIFRRISLHLLDRFSQSLHHMRVLWVQMIHVDLIFRFGTGRSHGNQNVAIMKANWYYVHSLHVCQMAGRFLFHYYLLGDDTEAHSGLFARLYHAFLVFFTMSKAIDFHDFFHQMEGICMNCLDPAHFVRFLKERCHGIQFYVASKTQTMCDFCNFYTIWKRFGRRW